MGVVYQATDPNIGRTVALKTLRVDVHGMESDEMLKRFHAEARNAGVLNHTNIVTIYDAQEIEGLFYIAMEFIQGQTLQELLKLGSVPVEKIIDISRQVCAGLDYAAARGIIHRDIKPANIMIQPDGTVKIMDFGIAKSAGTGMTSTGQVLGTPNYMSPEQVKGRTLDGRSDLFSLGVILYEMLTGERPFTGDNVTTIIYKIVNEQPPTPRDLDATVHPGLSAIVMKALAKNREERYQKGADLAADLLNYKQLGDEAQPAQASAAAAIPETARPPAPQTSRIVAMNSVGTAAAAKPAPQPAEPKKPAAVAKAAPVAASASRGPLLLGGVVLAVVLGVAGYVGLKFKTKSTPPAPSSSTETPSRSSTSETAPGPAPSAKGKTAAKPSAASAPQSEESAATGELRVTTMPAGATVTVDGSEQPQQTPAVLKLSPGEHTVVVSLDGYRPETRHPDITEGQRTPITVPLTPTVGFLLISSSPQGAEILIDDKPTGSVTPARVKAAPGQHTFAVRKSGYRNQAESAFVVVGQTVPMSFTLPATSGATRNASASQNVPPLNTANNQPAQPSSEGENPFRKLGRLFGKKEDSGKLEIRTNPKGAEILVNGSATGKKTPVKTDSPVGKYTITLQLPGYKTVTRTIEINKGQTTGIEEVLEKQ